MQSRNENFIFGFHYNILTDSPMIAKPLITASSIPPIATQLITENNNPLITEDSNNLIIE